ncbi:uncharacterized protein LOC115426795 [Xyrichtys novacula]|uniref:Uncharacterized protein LOC115426795 n=1 Tax=Xyrichtys novacula TaxID=13765 RepID=A0AAV1FEN1_XYRNO|nr:uncharacterized protein LOC115426795 [Xyrichtys novacula]
MGVRVVGGQAVSASYQIHREYWNNQKEELQRNYEAKLGNLSDELQTTHLIREAKVRELTQQVGDIVTMIAKGKDCDTGWKKYGLSCYFVSTGKKNWAASREDCKAQGADLVVINSEEEKDFLSGLVSWGENTWIGLTDSAQEGNWMWVDGTPVTTTYWESRQPDSFKGNQDCGEMVQRGEWNDEHCSVNNVWIWAPERRNKLPPKCGTVCVGLLLALLVVGNIGQLVYHAVSSTDREYYNNQREELQRNYEAKLRNLSDEVQATHLIREAKVRELTQQVGDIVTMIAKGKDCDTGWKKYGLSCYLVSTAKKNWAASREDCKTQGADLAIINSEEEQDFVTGLKSWGENTWIGLTDSAQEGNWMWVDGTPVTTTYWESGQPNSKKGNQDCGEMAFRGEWNDEHCSAGNIWICEKKLTF